MEATTLATRLAGACWVTTGMRQQDPAGETAPSFSTPPEPTAINSCAAACLASSGTQTPSPAGGAALSYLIQSELNQSTPLSAFVSKDIFGMEPAANVGSTARNPP